MYKLYIDKDSQMERQLQCIVLCITLMISSSKATIVCPRGNLTLTCHTNGTFLRWRISFPHHIHPEERIISSTGSANSQTPLLERSTYFQFLRTSRTPLISTMLIDNINADLHGTAIDCLFEEGRSTTVIDIIRNAFPTTIEVESEEFQSENVTITLKWAQGDNEFYNVAVVPHMPVQYTGSTTLELTLLYNIQYNMSIVAFLCEYNTTDIIELLYGKCSHPQQLVTDDRLVLNYNSYLTEGSNVTLSCDDSAMFELVGPKIITCTENGKWEPDPREVECKVDCGVPLATNSSINNIIVGNSTLIDSVLQFSCKEGFLPANVFAATCLENGRWSPDPAKHICAPLDPGTVLNQTAVILIAVVSSSIMLLMSCALFCIIGYACVRKCRRPTLLLDATSPFQLSQHNEPVYEDVQPKSLPTNQKKDYELKENVAYGPVKDCTYDDLHFVN